MKLSIVVPTRNRPHSLHRFLDSVFKNASEDVPFEVIVVDASDVVYGFDNVFSKEKVKVVREWPPSGATRGFNAGFRAAQGQYVVWFNDDVVLLPNWSPAAVCYMQDNPRVGIGAIYYMISTTNEGFKVNEWMGLTYANFGIIEREFGEKIGWMDESLHFYGCDNSIAFRCYDAGKVVRGIPGAKAIHITDFGDDQRESNARTKDRDTGRLLEKYSGKIEAMLKLDRECGPLPPSVISPKGFV